MDCPPRRRAAILVRTIEHNAASFGHSREATLDEEAAREHRTDATEPFVLGPEDSRGVGGGPWRTRVRGAATVGLLIIGGADMPPMSAGPSLHGHTHDDVARLVLVGVLTVVLGDERFDVPAGGIAWLLRGVPHTFANLTTEPVRVVGMAVPAGRAARPSGGGAV